MSRLNKINVLHILLVITSVVITTSIIFAVFVSAMYVRAEEGTETEDPENTTETST